MEMTNVISRIPLTLLSTAISVTPRSARLLFVDVLRAVLGDLRQAEDCFDIIMAIFAPYYYPVSQYGVIGLSYCGSERLQGCWELAWYDTYATWGPGW